MIAKTPFVLSAILGLALTAGCERKQEATAPPAQAPMPAEEEPAAEPQAMERQMREMCPMMVEDVDVEVTDVEEGVALTFTTMEGDVDDLRRRVRQMASMYEMRAGRGEMMWMQMRGRAHQRGMGHGGIGRMPEVRSSVEETESGSRVILRPQDPGELQALREHVRMHQQRMQAGACGMIHERVTRRAPAQME